MNLRSKWCLYGLLSWAAMAGIASAQQPPGSVQLGTPSAEQLPPPLTSLNEGVGQVNLGGGMGYTNVARQFRPRVNIDTRGGGLYGYSPGYTNIGMFMPYAIEDDSAILFLDARGVVTHDGRGGANVGAGWRWWMQDIDRVVGLSAWYDFDGGHSANYNQIGLSFESLGRYVDYRVNGYIPIGARSTTLSSTVDVTDTLFQGNSLVFRRTNVAEQTYTGFDAEVGGPLPILGRYGVNGYVGGYHFLGNGVQGGSFTGVSGRFMAQLNEDVSFGVQVTDDHLFGTNTQFQVFVTLPDGAPSRWLRNPRVQDRLTQSVYRQYRVMAHTDTYSTFDQAINPKDGLPYFVTHINPNLAATGTGTFENPFNSITAYNGQPLPAQQHSDIISVRRNTTDLFNDPHLDTNPTFTLFDGQRLLSTSVQHTFLAANFPGVVLPLPDPTGIIVGEALPLLWNSGGGDVITLAPGNVKCLEVSGFDIRGGGGNGISGTNNSFVLINRNDIHGAFNGINLVNLTNGNGIPPTATASVIQGNTLRDNVNDGFHLLNIGGPSVTTLQLTNNTAYGNGNNGFNLAADAGSTVGGLIDGNRTVPPAGGTTNGNNGLSLSSIGGTLAFNNPLALPALGQQISNNIFSNNSRDGVFVDVTLGGNANLLFLANTISTNGGAGIHVPTSDGSLINLVIGGPDAVLNRNTITDNTGPGILFDLSNTANGLTARIENNVISGNLDGIQVNVANAAVFGPAVGLNATEIFNNQITANRRDGIRLTRSGAANLNLGTPALPPIHNNNISLNLGNGLSLIATDTAAPPVILSTQDNVFNANVFDGLNILAGASGGVIDAVQVNFDSNRDKFTTNGRHGLNLITNDRSNISTNLVNVTANNNVQNGLNTVSNNDTKPGNGTGQVINIFSPTDPLYAGTSTFSNNGANGISTTANQTSLTTINLNPLNQNQIHLDGNGANGWNLDRFDASLILATAQNATFSNNGSNGIKFNYSGSPPTDPNQPLTPQFNQLTLNNIVANANGANGLHTAGTSDAVLVANVTLSTFNGNAINGIQITTELGSRFGNPPAPGSPRSIFDGLTITGNNADGIHINENSFLATGSNVYLEVNTNLGNTNISSNLDDGIHAVSDGNETNILLHSTAGNLLTINNNGANGVRWDVTSAGTTPLSHLFQIGDLGVPGSAVTIAGNTGDGIQFNAGNPTQTNVPSSRGNMNVYNSTITNSGGDGINVNVTDIGNVNGASSGFASLDARANVIAFNNNHGVNVQLQGANDERFASANVQVSLTGNNQIVSNGLNGVNVELRGLSESRFFGNVFVIDGNRIALNGQRSVFNQSHGIFFQEDAGAILRRGTNEGGFVMDLHRSVAIGTPRPTNPDGSFDLFIPLFGPGIRDYNTGDLANTAFFLSRYMNLATNLNSTLRVTNNIIEFNGPSPGAPGEGVFLRVSTNAYLSADVRANTFTGNGSSDFRTESFVTGGIPPIARASAAPVPDVVFLDDTAQLDLRLANNTGQSIQPRYLFGNQNLGAQYLNPDFYKSGNSVPRGAELFAVDNSVGVLATNAFTNLAAPQPTLFFNAGYHLNTTPFTLNNLGFPRSFGPLSTIGAGNSPNQPFLP